MKEKLLMSSKLSLNIRCGMKGQRQIEMQFTVLCTGNYFCKSTAAGHFVYNISYFQQWGENEYATTLSELF